MDIWLIWLDALRSTIATFSSDVGLGLGLAVIVATVALRALLLPLAWPIAYRACIRQKKMLKLQPGLKALRDAGEGTRFLWVPNLLRPDALLAVVAGVTTAVMMAVNPDMPEQMRIFLIVLPSVIAIVAALQFSSALAIYWATSNTFSALQTAVLHAVVRRRIRSGTISI